MPKVRYTITELGSNLKFILLTSFFFLSGALITQISVLQKEQTLIHESQQQVKIEGFVSQLRNGFHLIENNSFSTAVTVREIDEINKSFLDTEFLSFLGEDVKIIQNHFAQHEIDFYQDGPSHYDLSPEILNLIQVKIESYRDLQMVKSQTEIEIIQLLNSLGVGLTVMSLGLIFYATYFSLHGYEV
jgi:hypothetical protein